MISGYLITRHLIDDIGNNGRHIGQLLLRFYDKRLRRILPALTVVLLTTVAAGWFLLLPGDYAATGKAAAYSSFGLGNLYFYWNTGYFDRSAELQPLLHMWSLGVEEQYYFVWPLFLAAVLWIARGSRCVAVGLIAALVVAGLWYSTSAVAENPKAAFYLPQARAWELGIGGIVAFSPLVRNRITAELMGLSGLVLIGFTFCRLNGSETSLGIAMAPAVIGSALLVWPRTEGWMSRLLALPPFRFVGLISYSLYLWHWPVLVLFRHYANSARPNLTEALWLTAISFGLATLTWLYIEPLRHVRLRPRNVIATGISVSVAVSIVATLVASNVGFPGRTGEAANSMMSLETMWTWPCPQTTPIDDHRDWSYCVIGAPWETAQVKGALWGDSHAEAFMPLLDVAARKKGIALVLFRACPPIIDNDVVKIDLPGQPTYSAECAASRKAILDRITQVKAISFGILVARWSVYIPYYEGGKDAMSKGIVKLLEDFGNREMLIIGDTPSDQKDRVPCVLAEIVKTLFRRRCAEPVDPSVKSVRANTQTANDVLSAETKGRADLLLPVDRMCNDKTCPATYNDEYIYRDDSHFRRNLKPATIEALNARLGLDES